MLQAQLEAIDLHLARDDVHQPLDEIRRFGTSRAAVGVGRHLVRVHADDVERDRRDLVAAGEHETRERRDRRREQLEVRAEVRNRVRLQPENRAVVLHGDLVLADLIASVDGRRRVLAPPLDCVIKPVRCS